MSSTPNNGLKSKQKSGASLGELEHPPEKMRCCVSNILDLPKEILIEVILFLNARERAGLGNSCKRFHSLVFEDEELLRNLDFSKDGCLTSASDVQQYFNNKHSRGKILGVNVKNTRCITSCLLIGSIGKGRNLVDVNIHGFKFKDIWQLGTFLNPLTHLQRLSFDWSEDNDSLIPICCKVLLAPFSKLQYLSVEIELGDLVRVLAPSLRLCQELRKLRIVVKNPPKYDSIWSGETETLRNLKVAEYCGSLDIPLMRCFATLHPNPEKWANFQMDGYSGFYLAIVNVCEELAASKWIERISNTTPRNAFNLGWALIPELLLQEVIGITHENVPAEFCCFSTFQNRQRCALKINEAKRLAENPRSQISYLCMNHPLHVGCDFHLVASAFTNLTELRLVAVTRNLDSFPPDSHFRRRLHKPGEVVPEELNEPLNMDSSFRMLVKNTPYLRHFTLGGSGHHDNWDLDELRLIRKWKYLESLHLLNVPIENGEFLIEIGKRCKNLQNLRLQRLGRQDNFCYGKELLRMLTVCQNLRDFSIETRIFTEMSEMLSLLSNHVHLRRLHAKVTCDNYCTLYYKSFFISDFRALLDRCSELSTLVGEFDCTCGIRQSKVSEIQQSWMKELNRPHFQTKMRLNSLVWGTISEDSPDPHPFP